MSEPSVAVILLNWNNLEYTLPCIESLKKCTYPNFRIVVIDNASEDDSVQILQEIDNITVISNEENLGFAGGNNVGISHAINEGFEYVMLLNNDTLVEPDFIEPLVQKMKETASVGAIQPKMYFVHDRKLIWNAGGYFNSFWGYTSTIRSKEYKASYDVAKTTDWITGCCMMVPVKLVQEVGMLDARYFIYFEDVDWSFRISEAGKSLCYEPKSVIYHVAGASGKTKTRGKEGYLTPRVHYLTVRNHMFLLRSHTPAYLWPSRFVYQVFKMAGYTVYFVVRGRWTKLKAVWKGFIDGFVQ